MKKIILLLFACFLSFSTFAQVINYNVGDVVDNFTVTDTEGNEWTLYDITASGKYVYLDFFFDTCPPCQSTTRIFNEFHETYGSNQESLFMMSINNGTDSDAEVIAFEDQYGGDFEHAPAVSADGGAGAVDSNIGITAYPTYFLIGPDNKLMINDIWPINSLNDFEVTIPAEALGVEDATITDFQMFPNPSTGNEINIRLSNTIDQATVVIYNVLGKQVFTEQFDSNSFVVKNTNLASGTYIVNITTQQGSANKSLLVN